MKHLTRLRGYTDQMVLDANAVLYTFGSYRLGVRETHLASLCIKDCCSSLIVGRLKLSNFGGRFMVQGQTLTPYVWGLLM